MDQPAHEKAPQPAPRAPTLEEWAEFNARYDETRARCPPEMRNQLEAWVGHWDRYHLFPPSRDWEICTRVNDEPSLTSAEELCDADDWEMVEVTDDEIIRLVDDSDLEAESEIKIKKQEPGTDRDGDRAVRGRGGDGEQVTKSHGTATATATVDAVGGEGIGALCGPTTHFVAGQPTPENEDSIGPKPQTKIQKGQE